MKKREINYKEPRSLLFFLENDFLRKWNEPTAMNIFLKIGFFKTMKVVPVPDTGFDKAWTFFFPYMPGNMSANAGLVLGTIRDRVRDDERLLASRFFAGLAPTYYEINFPGLTKMIFIGSPPPLDKS